MAAMAFVTHVPSSRYCFLRRAWIWNIFRSGRCTPASFTAAIAVAIFPSGWWKHRNPLFPANRNSETKTVGGQGPLLSPLLAIVWPAPGVPLPFPSRGFQIHMFQNWQPGVDGVCPESIISREQNNIGYRLAALRPQACTQRVREVREERENRKQTCQVTTQSNPSICWRDDLKARALEDKSEKVLHLCKATKLAFCEGNGSLKNFRVVQKRVYNPSDGEYVSQTDRQREGERERERERDRQTGWEADR